MDKRTWAEVDLDAIAHNIKEIRKITNPNAKIMAVVKDVYKRQAYMQGGLTYESAKLGIMVAADKMLRKE